MTVEAGPGRLGPGPAPTGVRRLLAEHGVSPRRALGQHFLADPNTARRIARLAGVGPGDRVVEIGAGLGALTLALAETGASVTAVEVDRHLLAPLRAVAEPAGAEVVEGDALTLDWGRLVGPGPWVVVANLPYNVATPLVLRLLEDVAAPARMLVMVQAEVGERLAAGVGSPSYGAVSVRVTYWARAEVLGRVPPTVFVPRPRVESALVGIQRRPEPAVDPDMVGYPRLVEVVKAGFAQRRKMLRRSLAGVVPGEAFGAAGVDPRARAEELDVSAWGRLAACRPGPSGHRPS